jgi:ketosteroid isomerase-like protein
MARRPFPLDLTEHPMTIASRAPYVALLCTLLCTLLVAARPLHAQTGDAAAVAATVRAFHDALARGDSLAALALLAEDAVILESGGRETRAEYRSHHLAADIAFAQAVRAETAAPEVTVQGDVAWAAATTVARGEYGGRPVESAGAELMVLSHGGDGWRIRAIHWSSRPRRSP